MAVRDSDGSHGRSLLPSLGRHGLAAESWADGPRARDSEHSGWHSAIVMEAAETQSGTGARAGVSATGIGVRLGL